MPVKFAAEELVALMSKRIFFFLEQVGLQIYIESGQLSGTA